MVRAPCREPRSQRLLIAGFCALALPGLLACGESRSAPPVADGGADGAGEGAEMATPGLEPVRPSWEFELAGKAWRGAMGSATGGDRGWALSLFDPDAVNVNLILVRGDDGAWKTEAGLVAFGREQRCRTLSLPDADHQAAAPAFTTRIEALDSTAMAGTFAGEVRCEDDLAVPLTGSFRVPLTRLGVG